MRACVRVRWPHTRGPHKLGCGRVAPNTRGVSAMARACVRACPVLCGPKCVRVTTIYGFNTFLEPKVIIIRPHAYASRVRLVRFALAYMRSVLRWCLNAKYVPNTPTCAHKQLPIHLYERARARALFSKLNRVHDACVAAAAASSSPTRPPSHHPNAIKEPKRDHTHTRTRTQVHM